MVVIGKARELLLSQDIVGFLWLPLVAVIRSGRDSARSVTGRREVVAR